MSSLEVFTNGWSAGCVEMIKVGITHLLDARSLNNLKDLQTFIDEKIEALESIYIDEVSIDETRNPTT